MIKHLLLFWVALFAAFWVLNAQGATVTIKDPVNDYQMIVNSDGSINTNGGGGGGGGIVTQGPAGTQPWPVISTPQTTNSSSITNITATANTSTLLIAANTNRLGLNIYDETGTECFVAMKSSSSSSVYSFIMVPRQNWVMDQPVYKGAISAYCSNSGNILLTEY